MTASRSSRAEGLALVARLLGLALLVAASCACTLGAAGGAVSGPSEVTPAAPSPSTQPSPSATPTASATPSRTPTATPLPPTSTPTPTLTSTPTQTRVPHLIAIDAGHGGIDLGTRHFDANGHMDVHESEVTLALALQLRDELLARGYRVFLTRDGDYRVSKDETDLNGDGQFTMADEAQARVDLLNTSGAELLLSIHENAYWPNGVPDQSVGGPSTFYCADRPFADESLRFARLVQYHIVEAVRELGYDADDRGVWDDLEIVDPTRPGTHLILLGPVSERIVRASSMPGALNETLFLSNDIETRLLVDAQAQAAMVSAYADAIDAYFDGQSAPESE